MRGARGNATAEAGAALGGEVGSAARVSREEICSATKGGQLVHLVPWRLVQRLELVAVPESEGRATSLSFAHQRSYGTEARTHLAAATSTSMEPPSKERRSMDSNFCPLSTKGATNAYSTSGRRGLAALF